MPCLQGQTEPSCVQIRPHMTGPGPYLLQMWPGNCTNWYINGYLHVPWVTCDRAVSFTWSVNGINSDCDNLFTITKQ